ncbi:MAG: ATP-binding cassette domain-containing protein [Lachnospiraceae bacterium]|jgi:ATP-binding cassette subfamily F protein 3|nr:ATP-binding cassette domain-containing protein [Lachnospiraceae bacterium]MCH4063727.1 ATP-binding cassette domain-containing protein [Lachnospiraceae bacterium]MCH4103550.1 ATP-binding cassette domain-containing protein [Lachnospiraceae bacterium]MCI1310174.1 ATP-binding cassette domain-containing protein [Lachnospiraceae bacterium]MCI1334635.1 ATP-binding cassette domain-containing protein [Lachnospiraceae bacterium]
MLLEIRDGTVSRGGKTVLERFSFDIKGTEHAAIVGRNGAGKTTLLEVIAGTRELDADEKNPGSGLFRSRAFTVGMLHQTAVSDPELTVEEAMRTAILSGKPEDFRWSEERFAEEQRYDKMFTRFGFAKEDKQKKLGAFSGGEQIKIALIRLLLAEPDVLVLDEPTNHLDLAAVEWLEQYLREYRKAVVMVSHDRYFIDQVADVVWEVTHGRAVRYPGNYTQYRAAKAARYKRQLAAWRRQQEEIARQDELIEKFRHKPKKAKFARSRKKMLERMTRIEKPDMDDAVIHTGEILPARPGSKWVLECEHLKIGYEKSQPVKELSFRLRRGQKVGIIGPNGTGKSTFLKTVAGLLQPLAGKVSLGAHIDLAYFDQMTAGKVLEETAAAGSTGIELPTDTAEFSGADAAASGSPARVSSKMPERLNVIEYFHSRFPSLTGKEVRTILAGFLFTGRDLGTPVDSLSGGEKSRLVLATLLQSRPNFLVLDEPTNNMDIPAKETLESLFREYKGTILFVSHNRYFLSEVADALLIFEQGDQPVMYHPFGYRHYEERRRREMNGDPAVTRTAEDERLIADLRAVPKGESHRLREIPTEEAALDWRFHLCRMEIDQAEERVQQEEEALGEMMEPAWNTEVSYAEDSDNIEPDITLNDVHPTIAEYLETPSSEKDPRILAQQKRLEDANQKLTETLLVWYDLWLETH